MKTNFGLQELKDLLLKKAYGFYYTEQTVEFERGKNDSSKNEQISIDTCREFSKDALNERVLLGKDCINESFKELVVAKKKISSHYVPPDSVAIKMLFEIFGKEIVGEGELEKIKKLTDKELDCEIKKVEEQIKKEEEENG